MLTDMQSVMCDAPCSIPRNTDGEVRLEHHRTDSNGDRDAKVCMYPCLMSNCDEVSSNKDSRSDVKLSRDSVTRSCAQGAKVMRRSCSAERSNVSLKPASSRYRNHSLLCSFRHPHLQQHYSKQVNVYIFFSVLSF